MRARRGQVAAEYLVVVMGLLLGVLTLGLFRQRSVAGQRGNFFELLTGTYTRIVEDLTIILNLPF